jgi:predicted Zn-dependent peptidase
VSEARRSDAELTQHTVGNGLRVVVASDRSAPAVAVNIWYNVGSRHEEPGRTGFAHLFEHLMFQGSEHVASGEHFRLLQGSGASLNATTSFERTNYFETVPAGALELSLWLEADRMASLLAALDQANLDNQRDVVKNERRQRYDNQPYGTAWEHLYGLTFPPGHPYHHMPIGSMEDLDAATLDDAAGFFRRHYMPGNAVLSIVGDVAPAEAVRLAERYFARVPAAAVPPQPATEPLGPLAEPARLVLDEAVPSPALYSMWRTAPDGTAEADAADLALEILAGGSGSRLASRLIRRDELARGAYGGLSRFVRADSSATLVVRARADADIAAVETALDSELRLLAEDGPSDEEMTRAIAMKEREWLDETSDFGGQADQLSRFATLFADPGLAATATARLGEVTPEQVRQAARQLLPPHAARVIYPGQGGEGE